MLGIIAAAAVVGLTCHWLMRRLDGDDGPARYILVSFMASLVPGALVNLAHYIGTGEAPDIAAFPIFVVIVSFPIALAAGVPFIGKRRALDGHCKTCGRNLRGNIFGVCPECGTKVEPADNAAV